MGARPALGSPLRERAAPPTAPTSSRKASATQNHSMPSTPPAGFPQQRVHERGQRQEDEAEGSGRIIAVVGAVDLAGEDPNQDEAHAGKQASQQREEAAHGP